MTPEDEPDELTGGEWRVVRGIADDDPRHGTTAGYHAGCKGPCCRKAMARYEKAGRLARLNGGLAVPALGAQRRIQALMRLGWTSTDIAVAGGFAHRNHVFRILKGQKGKPSTWLQRGTDKTVREVYERLSMTIPEPTPWRRRAQCLAERNGWPPPLAWDDIDDKDEHPKGVGHCSVDRATALRDLSALGVGITEACKRLHTSRDGLEKWCARHGMSDVYRELAGRETVVREWRNQHSREAS